MDEQNINIVEDNNDNTEPIEEKDEKEHMIEELSDMLAQTFIDNIEVLSSIALLTERFYDGSHSRFVAEKCLMVAEELGMDEESTYELKIAALLHDIGKITFFDSALHKNINEMSPLEYEHYKYHVDVGVYILKKHKHLENVANIVFQHHEKLDGSGFPQGLKEDSILPAAKIISVVNFFHNTVYKKPRTRSGAPARPTMLMDINAFLEATKTKYNFALNFLHNRRGILFEKKVVEVFIDIIQAERMSLGQKAVMRVPINKIEPGMVFAEDYYTKQGILIAAKGEAVKKEMIPALVRFAENDQLPMKILVLK
ncbi:MAG TPA: HD domain-containing protein [Candidatus Kapabacteria bacterium]|jgi:putative nucleotidyltransferase with HDIG domain|nr:HD domain-containing protein [Candidatus Kapabacteria bacterium]